MDTITNQTEDMLLGKLISYIEESISFDRKALTYPNLPEQLRLKKLNQVEKGQEILEHLKNSPLLSHLYVANSIAKHLIALDPELDIIEIVLKRKKETTNKISAISINVFEDGEQRT